MPEFYHHHLTTQRFIAALPLPLRKGFAFPIQLSKDLAAMPPEAEPQEKAKRIDGKPEAFRKDSGKAAVSAC